MATSRTRTLSDGVPRRRRRQWTCPACHRLFKRRTGRKRGENAEEFYKRCVQHQASGRACAAIILTKQLLADGLVPLRSKAENDFLSEYLGLNQAGLVQWHFTHVLTEDFVRRSPWGPAWAAQYDYHLRRHKKRSLHARAEELRELAATPEGREAAMAFLALGQFDVDLGGDP